LKNRAIPAAAVSFFAPICLAIKKIPNHDRVHTSALKGAKAKGSTPNNVYETAINLAFADTAVVNIPVHSPPDKQERRSTALLLYPIESKAKYHNPEPLCSDLKYVECAIEDNAKDRKKWNKKSIVPIRHLAALTHGA